MPHSSRRARIGQFEVDFEAGQVSRHGRSLPVQDQPFRLLMMLLDRPGEVVSREEIRARLWPADTFVSFDDGLNTAVRKLRVLFRDSADNPHFIETLPRQGYRFIAPVTEIAQVAEGLNTTKDLLSRTRGSAPSRAEASIARPLESGHQEAIETAEPQPPRRDPGSISGGKSTPASSGANSIQAAALQVRATTPESGLRIAAGLALLFTILAVAFPFRPALPPPRITGSTMLTNDGRAKATMVTDGSRIYFSYSGFAKLLYQVSTAGGDVVSFPSPIANPIVIDISPDHSRLLVWSCPPLYVRECPLWIVPVLGGAPRRAGDLRSSLLDVDRDGRGRSPDAAWSPNGKELLYVHEDWLWRANIDGSGARVVFRPPNGETIYWPRWSPDQSRVRFSLGNPNSANAIWEVTEDGHNPHPLLSGWNSPPSECCGSWTSDTAIDLAQNHGHTEIGCAQ
jgi:DNA-binding winged helix-turn-helix (wHTH) protein